MRKHVHYFDFLRLMAAFSVVYMHVAAGLLRREINLDWQLTNIVTSFAFTAVPLFFMMSGYLLLSDERTLDTNLLLKKRLPRLIVPLAGWTVVALLWKAVAAWNFSPYSFLGGLVDALSTPAWIHFWYLYTLIPIYLLAPLLCGGLRSLDRKGHALILGLIGLVSLQAILKAVLPASFDKLLNIDLISKMSFYGGHLCTFVLGYYLGNIKKRIPNWILATSIVVLLCVISMGTFVLTEKNGTYMQTFQGQAAGFEILLAACVFLLFKQILDRKAKFFQCIPVIPLALPIYLMHNILLSMLAVAVSLSAKSFFDTLWITLLIFTVSYLVMKTVATIKPLCFLATGMSYQKACESCNWIYTWRRLRKKAKTGSSL